MLTVRKVLTLVMLVLALGSSLTLLVSLRMSASPSAGSKDDNGITAEISDFNSIMNSLDAQTSQLQKIKSGSSDSTVLDSAAQQNQTQQSFSSALNYAQLAAPTLEGTLVQLNGERTQLQSKMGDTENANLSGEFLYKETPLYSIVGGVYANTGLRTAYTASVTFTFYSQPNMQGTILCTLISPLGDIVAGSVVSIGRLECGSGSVTTGSVTFQFQWTSSSGTG